MLLAGDAPEGGQVMDWSDEVRARLEAPSTVSGTWGVPEDGPWCVKREADIRAALGEIKRLQSIEDAHVGCVAGNWAERALKAEVRAKAAEAEVERLKTALRDIALLDHHEHGPAGKGSDLARAALRGGGE